MSMSVVARSALWRQQLRPRVFHSSAPARSAGHGDYHHLPFDFPGNKKFAFGLKLSAFLISGFSIPFVASYHQIQKSKGAE